MRPAERERLTEWTVEKIARCQSLNQAAALKTTMQHRGAYYAQTESAYEALRAELAPRQQEGAL